jgi:tetratricopeptide (TPR) repeat protein
MLNLAWLLTQKGDFKGAEGLYRRVIDIRRKHLSEDHRDVALARVALAAMLLEAGRAPLEALTLTTRAMATFRKLEGDRSEMVAATHFQKGVVAQLGGNHKEAVSQLRKALDLGGPVLGNDHPYTALMWFQLAFNLERVGQVREAEAAYQKCLGVVRKTVGFEHPQSLRAVRALAWLLSREGRPEEGVKLFEECVARRRKQLGNEDPIVAEALEEFAAFQVRRSGGDAARGEALYREALAVFRKADVYRYRAYADALNSLAALVERKGEHAEAEKLYREMLTVEAKATDVTIPPALVRSNLGWALLRQKKTAEAERWFTESLALYRKQPRKDVAMAAPLRGLAEVRAAQGRVKEAERLRQEAAGLLSPPGLGVSYRLGPEMQLGLAAGPFGPAQKKLTYAEDGKTNSVVVQVGGRVVPFGSAAGKWETRATPLGKGPDGKARRGHRGVWSYEGVNFTQTVEVVAGGSGNACLVRYEIENGADGPRAVGLRFLLDTYLVDNDGHPFALPGSKELITTRADFRSAAEVPGHVRALQSADPDRPGLEAILTLKVGGAVEAPERCSITHWQPEGKVPSWEVPVRDIGDDAAAVLYWAPRELPRGGRRHLGFAYGLGVVDLGGAGGKG